MSAWIGVLVATALAAFFSLAELSIVSMSRLRLRQWVQEKMGGSDRAVDAAIERPLALLSPILAGHTLAITAAAMLTAVVVAEAIQGPLAIAVVSVAVLAPPLFLLVETLPRAVARRRAHQLFPVVSRVLRVCGWLFGPLNAVARALTRVVAGSGSDAPGHWMRGRRGLETILLESARAGVVESEEVEIIQGVFEFGRTPAGAVMTEARHMVTAPADAPAREIAVLVRETGFSRIPLLGDGTVVGMVHVFDLFRFAPDERPRPRPVVRARYDTPCNALLLEMKRRRCHLAVVMDRGAVAGLVSLEDLVEELVGEIRDEHDPREGEFSGSIVVDGHRLITDIRAEHGLDLSGAEARTVAGYVIARAGRIPRTGETIHAAGWAIDILDATQRRVRRVRFRHREPGRPPTSRRGAPAEP